MTNALPAVHEGNFYSVGEQRILRQLRRQGVPVPAEALEPMARRDRPTDWNGSRLLQALLDWFSGRDFVQAQQLIHFSAKPLHWHGIFTLNQEDPFTGLSDGTLCPSLLDALGAVISHAAEDFIPLAGFVRAGDDVLVMIDDRPLLRIAPLTREPFEPAIRARVRVAFKGLRKEGFSTYAFGASHLPGFPREPRPPTSATAG